MFFFTGFVFFVRAEGSKRWDKQYYRRSKEGGEELGGGGRCLPRDVQQQQQQQQHQDQQKPHQSFCAIPSQTSWFPASWCRLFQKKPKKPPSPSGEKGGGGEGRLTVISCNSQVCTFLPSLIQVVCFTVPPHFQYKNQKQVSANHHFVFFSILILKLKMGRNN